MDSPPGGCVKAVTISTRALASSASGTVAISVSPSVTFVSMGTPSMRATVALAMKFWADFYGELAQIVHEARRRRRPGRSPARFVERAENVVGAVTLTSTTPAAKSRLAGLPDSHKLAIDRLIATRLVALWR